MSRKLTIRPGAVKRVRRSINAQTSSSSWDILASAVAAVFAGNESALSYEELYRNVFGLIRKKRGAFVYDHLKNVFAESCLDLATSFNAEPDDRLLPVLAEAWTMHAVKSKRIRDIFLCLDKQFVPTSGRAKVYDMSLEVFRDIVMTQEVGLRLRRRLLLAIHDDRVGNHVRRSEIRVGVQLIVDLGINSLAYYEDFFETPFLAESSEFFNAEALQYLAENTCADYVEKAAHRLHEDVDRCEQYVHATTLVKLDALLIREFISNHLENIMIIDNGLLQMLQDDKVEHLRMLYDLVRRVDGGVEQMAPIIQAFVESVGRACADEADPVAFVTSVNGCLTHYSFVCEHAFNNNRLIAVSLRNAYAVAINSNDSCPEHLSLFINRQIRDRTLSEELTEDFGRLFHYLHDKDKFETYYKSHLAARLLGVKACAIQDEKAVIQILKSACGYAFTAKLEAMLSDVETAAELNRDYEAFLGASHERSGVEPLPFSFAATVLTFGKWPFRDAVETPLPRDLETAAQSFRSYYRSRNSGRRVTYLTEYGNGELDARFESGKHTLVVSTPQLITLLLFNDAPQYTFGDLVELTRLSRKRLKIALIPLFAAKKSKANMLVSSGSRKKVAADDVFTLNPEFKSRKFRINMCKDVRRVSQEDKAVIDKKIEDDRKYEIDAAAVRVAKSRRVINHAELVAEVTSILSARFSPSPKSIKTRIEVLIDRGYLERFEDNRRKYRYLA